MFSAEMLVKKKTRCDLLNKKNEGNEKYLLIKLKINKRKDFCVKSKKKSWERSKQT